MIKKSVILFFLLIKINGFAQNINEWGAKNYLKSVSKIEKKVALVIGNTNYDEKSWNLKNPINDGKLMYKTFKKLNFEVDFKKDLNRIQFIDEIIKFNNKLNENDLGIIYYAGHALQDQNGNSYILASDFTHDSRIEKEGIDISNLISALERSKNKCLIILDACRNENNDGLPKPNIKDPLNVKLGYSTSYGKTASDDTNLENTIYTKFLSDMFLIPEITLETILYNTAMQVLLKTNERQQPTSYFGIYLNKMIISSSN